MNRWFAVRLNNQVWDVLDSGTVTAGSPDSERTQLLYRAQAAAHHWYQVGTAANHARAEYLVARAAIASGNFAEALRHALATLELCTANPDLVADWDLAMAHEALARAQAANGMTERATATFRTARTLVAAIADPQDRAVADGELAREPWFGLNAGS